MRVGWISVGLSVIFAALYLWASPSLAFQHWDSLEYGHATDSRPASAIWGNHPLGHMMHRGVYSAARALGYRGHALPVLKGFSALAGGVAVGALFALLAALSDERTRAGLAPALGAALILGGSYGFWHFAGTADIYTLATVALITALAALLSAVRRASFSRSALAGALAGIATLSHQLTGVLLAVIAVGLLPLWASHPRGRALRAVAAWSFSGALVVISGYAVIGSLAVGSFDPDRILTWARGYGGDPTYGRYLTWEGVRIAAYAATATLARESAGAVGLARQLVIGLSLLGLAIGARRLSRLPSESRTIARAAGLQCVLGAALVLWWEPGLIGKFWILLLPGLLIWSWYTVRATTAMGPTASRRLVILAPVAAGLLLLAFNWSNSMRLERRANVVFERSLDLWIAHSQPNDVIIETGEYSAHLLFWARRPATANVYRLLREGHRTGDPYAPLRALIERARRDGRNVLFAPGLSSYFTDDRLSIVGTDVRSLVSFFESYRRDGPLFEYQADAGLPSKAVYRLWP